nr:MAG TPA: hypothetical protein [Caudoviricetes sp.]
MVRFNAARHEHPHTYYGSGRLKIRDVGGI